MRKCVHFKTRKNLGSWISALASLELGTAERRWTYTVNLLRHYNMPVPRSLIEQLALLIPPLNGSLHKGQAGIPTSGIRLLPLTL